MEKNLKRGILDVCVLAVLRKGDSYGYQIIKDMTSVMEISESTLYPVLKRLENSKLIDLYVLEHNGRFRKYYHLTEQGVEKLSEFEQEWKEVMNVYNFIVKECD